MWPAGIEHVTTRQRTNFHYRSSHWRWRQSWWVSLRSALLKIKRPIHWLHLALCSPACSQLFLPLVFYTIKLKITTLWLPLLWFQRCSLTCILHDALKLLRSTIDQQAQQLYTASNEHALSKFLAHLSAGNEDAWIGLPLSSSLLRANNTLWQFNHFSCTGMVAVSNTFERGCIFVIEERGVTRRGGKCILNQLTRTWFFIRTGAHLSHPKNKQYHSVLYIRFLNSQLIYTSDIQKIIY